jgi:hypothetical protein
MLNRTSSCHGAGCDTFLFFCAQLTNSLNLTESVKGLSAPVLLRIRTVLIPPQWTASYCHDVTDLRTKRYL